MQHCGMRAVHPAGWGCFLHGAVGQGWGAYCTERWDRSGWQSCLNPPPYVHRTCSTLASGGSLVFLRRSSSACCHTQIVVELRKLRNALVEESVPGLVAAIRLSEGPTGEQTVSDTSEGRANAQQTDLQSGSCSLPLVLPVSTSSGMPACKASCGRRLNHPPETR